MAILTSKHGEVVKTVLKTVGIAGVLVVGAAAPGLFQLVPREMRRGYKKESYYQAYHRLGKHGWIAITQSRRGVKIVLTRKGREELKKYEFGEKTIRVPRKWDKKWRMLIFDVKENRRSVRTQIRRWLLQIGFMRLQDSVWVHPYECSDVLEMLRTRFDVRAEALYIRAEHIDHDRWLRKEFGLS